MSGEKGICFSGFFPSKRKTSKLKQRMLITSTLSDSGCFQEFLGVRLSVFIQDLRGIMHFIVQAHAVVRTIQQYPKIWMLITSTTKQMSNILVHLTLSKQCLMLIVTDFHHCYWSSLLHVCPLCTKVPYTQLWKVAVAFFKMSASALWARQTICVTRYQESEKKHAPLYSGSFLFDAQCLRNGICMWMSAHPAVTFRLSHCN